MINFHKFGFLDAKKLRNYLADSNYWLSRYNPIWLFIWSDLYKPEICFTNNHCFIRYLQPEIGMVYYPPLGGDLKLGIEEIKEDAWDNGIDFSLGPVVQDELFKYDVLKIKLYNNRDYASYIYLSSDLAFTKKGKLKSKRALCMQFEKNHKNAYVKRIKKEEFPEILEFINEWNLKAIKDINDVSFYAKLNMIKRCIEHLYELDLIGIVLRDEEKIYGLAIGSVMGNLATLHVNLAMSDEVGAQEEVVAVFAKTVSSFARYISFEEDLGVEEVRRSNEEYNPLRIEEFYSTFSI